MPSIDLDVVRDAYAAGLFDGEGSVGIAYVRGTREKKYHRLHVSVTNTDLRVLVWLRGNFGGSVGHHRRGAAGCKDSWRWGMSGAAAERFLRAVRPHLIIKAEQADIGLALRSLKQRSAGVKGQPRGAGVTVTPEVEAERESLRSNLVQLNRRGAI